MSPHVLYVTPIFGYPALGGPRLRTYNTLRALARCAEVSLFVTDQPDTQDRELARAHLLTFCRDVVFPEPDPVPALSGVRGALRAVLPLRVRAAVREVLSLARAFGGRRTLTPALSQGERASSAPPRDPAVVAALRAWIQANAPEVVWLGFGGISYDLVPLGEETGRRVVLETECVWSRFVLRELPFVQDARRRTEIVRAGRAKEAEERAGAALVDITTAVSEVDADYFDPSWLILPA